MRMNLPVTHQCYEVPEGTTLMSTTDLKGRITYANPAFVAACGIEREDLLGQPHNVVRHPDMPPAAFADMWRTLKAGDSWTALVKNRRANGDFYWVRANAAPVSRQGQVVGYLSVRTRAQPADVQAADDLYRRLRDGQAGALRFHKGLAVHGGWRAPLSLARTLPLAWRLAAGVVLAAVGGVGAAAAAGVAGAALAATAAGMTAAAAAGWALLQAQVARPLAQVLHEAQRVAAGGGDGQARLDRVDEIGLLMRAVNQAGLNLRALVDDVGEQVAGVRSASHEIAAGARDLSARTEGAAGHLEETAASMEQLHGTVNHSADHAQQASRLAAQASSAAAGGSQVVDGVVGTMDGITRSARRIGDIVGVIDGIAFQTNLLALNAAVEAARAGDAGPRLRGGGRRGACTGKPQRRRRARDQGPDRDQRQPGAGRLAACHRSRAGHAGHRAPGAAGRHADRRDQPRRTGAGRRRGPGQQRGGAAGRRDAAERGAGRAVGRRRHPTGRPGGAPGRGGAGLPAGGGGLMSNTPAADRRVGRARRVRACPHHGAPAWPASAPT
jgi:aerotaxis receptor